MTRLATLKAHRRRQSNAQPAGFRTPDVDPFVLDRDYSMLVPPYVAASRIDAETAGDPPLGTVVIAELSSSPMAALAQLTLAANAWSWIIPCVAIPPSATHLRHAVLIISELRERLAIAMSGTVRGAANIARAVRHREPPTATAMARWVARRLSARQLARDLQLQFAEALQQVPANDAWSTSTYSRHFATLGRFTARDWRALARLCVNLADRTTGTHSTLSQRSIDAHLRRYLGMTHDQSRRLLGWEWILELALRRAGYLAPADTARHPEP